MQKCNACGGTYEPIQRDGSEYYHVCPPLSEYVNLDTGEVVSSDVAADPPAGMRIDVRHYPRDGHRNENIDLEKTRRARRDDPNASAVIISEGAGAVEVA